MAQTIGSFDLASLKNLRDDVTQYFWFESDSSSAWGSGAHVTLYPESQFTDSTSPNYMKGQNIIMNTDGFSIRNGGLPMMVLDNDSLDFNAVDTSLGTYTTMATFGLTGATIGQTSGAHSVIDADGQRFYASDGTTQLANIGYASGTAQSGIATAPYYDFGIRKSGTTKGNYSVVEGSNTTASGYASHAEGLRCEATSMCAHAEGDNTSANTPYSHAEGMYTEIREIYGTYASHVGGRGTVANGSYRTAIGSYNEDDLQIDTFIGDGTTKNFYTTYPADNGVNGRYDIEVTVDGVVPASISQNNGNQITINNPIPPDGSVIKIIYPRTATAFVIGNGTSNSARSNALTVDWSGNVVANGTIKASNSTPSISITTSTGTRVSSTIRRFGNVVQLLMTVQNSSSIAQGGNIYEGTITTTALRPILTTTGGSYYSTSAITGTISTAGDIVIRNEGGAKSFTSNCNISFTYIVA